MTEANIDIRQSFEWVYSVEMPSEAYPQLLDIDGQLPLFWVRSINPDDVEE